MIGGSTTEPDDVMKIAVKRQRRQHADGVVGDLTGLTLAFFYRNRIAVDPVERERIDVARQIAPSAG